MPSATLDARPAVLRYNEAGTLATRVVFEFVDGAGDPDVSLDGEAFQWAIAPDDRRSPAIRVRLDAVAADGEVVFEVSGAEAKAQGRVKTQTQELVYRPAGASPQPWVRGRLPMREAIADGDPENDAPEEVRFRLTIGEDGPVEITSIIVRGPQGIPATIEVGTVTTGEPGTDVEVVNSGTEGAAVFDFTIPRGTDGADYEILQDSAAAPYTLTDADDRKRLFISTGGIVTVNEFSEGVEMEVVHDAAGGAATVVFAAGTATLVAPEGLTLLARGQSAHLVSHGGFVYLRGPLV